MTDPLQTFGFGQWTMAAVRFLCYGSGMPVAITARPLVDFVTNGRWKVILDAASCYLHFVSISEKYFVLFGTPHIETIYCKALKSRAMGIWLFRTHLVKVQY